MQQPVSLSERVRAKARALGFDAVGIAPASPPLERDYERYRLFLERGFHGDMEWLARDAEVRRRVDTDDILPCARSVICLARSYARNDADHTDPPFATTIARYARGRDYHNGVRKKLRQLATFVRSLGEGITARPLCDDAPILERAWAARAGLGFIGKNGLLIVPGQGSLLLLGEVVTTLDLEPDMPIPERCGACTRCIDICPTQAIATPFVVDARRCVAYLTIELRAAVPEDLRAGVGSHLFGCDDCQTVCPFNKSPRARATHTSPFEPLERWATTGLADLLARGDVGEGTPLRRATADGLARNAAIVLGNRKDPGSLTALRNTAEGHPSAMVRDAALWAIARISDAVGAGPV